MFGFFEPLRLRFVRVLAPLYVPAYMFQKIDIKGENKLHKHVLTGGVLLLIIISALMLRLYLKPRQNLEGIDISHYNGDISVETFRNSKKDFVFLKATEGVSLVDGNYAANITKAREAGLIVGSYHFYVTRDTAEAQFKHFSSNASVEKGDLPPVVDIEALKHETGIRMAQDLQTFLDLLEKKYNVEPIIYSDEAFANQYLKNFSGYPLWVAEYTSTKTPKLPKGWTHWTFWQYSQSGNVEGIDRHVDLSRFNGSSEELRSFLIR